MALYYAKRIADRLAPADGWWQGDTHGQWADIVNEMLQDMGDDQVEDLLGRVIALVRAEYGD